MECNNFCGIDYVFIYYINMVYKYYQMLRITQV